MSRRMWSVAVVVVQAAVALPAQGEPTISAIALPSRHADAILEHARRVARLAGERSGAQLCDAAPGPPVDLSAPLSRARALSEAASLDAAANLYDQTLEAGARTPHRLVDVSGFVTAHIERASIALARGERRRAEELLERIVRYDPSVTLLTVEASPPLEASLASVRVRLGDAPELRGSDLGEACRVADRVVVARALHDGTIAYTLLAQCRTERTLIVRSTLSDEDVAADLIGLPRSAPRAKKPIEPTTSGGRRVTIGSGLVALGIGVAAIGVGSYFGWYAYATPNDLQHSCSAGSPCSAADVAARESSGRNADTAAKALFITGGIVAAAGVVLTLVGWRMAKRHARDLAWRF